MPAGAPAKTRKAIALRRVIRPAREVQMIQYVPVFARRPWLAALLLVWASGCHSALCPIAVIRSPASWNDGRQSGRRRVRRPRDAGRRAGLRTCRERIATFDNDGTLWAEQPIYFQFAFAIDRVKALAAEHPEWQEKQPFKAVIEGDLEALAASGEKGLLEIGGDPCRHDDRRVLGDRRRLARHGPPSPLRAALHRAGLPADARAAGLPARRAASRPSSSPAAASSSCACSPNTSTASRPSRWSALGRGEVRAGTGRRTGPDEGGQDRFHRRRPGKPVGINRFIGRRPIMAFGNSDGDLQMLQWTTAGDGPRFGLIVHHNDAEREWAYDRDSHIGRLDKALEAAGLEGWVVVSMKDDWQTIFAEHRNEPPSPRVAGRGRDARCGSAGGRHRPRPRADRRPVGLHGRAYLWADPMDGHASVGGTKSDVDLPFNDILKDLSFGAMMRPMSRRAASASASTACMHGSRRTAMWARSRSTLPATPRSSPSRPTTAWSNGTIARRLRAGRCACRRARGRLSLHLPAHRARGARRPDRRPERELGRPADRLAHRAGPLGPLGDRRRGQVGGFGVGSDFTWNVQAFVGYRTTLFGRETTFALGYRALIRTTTTTISSGT